MFGLNILFFQKHTYCTNFQIHIVAKFQIQKNRWEHFSLLQLNRIRIKKDSCFLFCIVQDSIFDRVLLLSWIYQSGRNSRMSKRFAFTLQPLFPPLPLPTSTIRELKQTRRRRKRERHLKMYLRVSVIIFQLFKVIMFEKCVLTTLELIWNQRLGHKKTKLSICHHMLTSSTQLESRSFHVVERTRTSTKCQNMKNARAKRAKYCFSLSNMQICGVFVAVVVVVA